MKRQPGLVSLLSVVLLAAVLVGRVAAPAAERDRKRREATLHRIQQLMHERVMYAPIWEVAVLNAYGRGWRRRPWA